MKIKGFFEELFKEGSIDGVLKKYPELTFDDVKSFFEEVINRFDDEDKVELYVDGASSGNPGSAGIGVVIKSGDRVLKSLSKSIGKTTNNVAEYTALIVGLKEVLDLGIKKVSVYSDSELVVKQVNGIYRVNNERLKKLKSEIEDLKSKFDEFSITHVPREKNRFADRLAKEGCK
ncbi:ribonuclease HI family protein [Hippea alviniae]|uniref:ribonuclease HI family protein n=1 Tax=Hippea alviniae TaxID=1279027 RepID=UPI0003B46132|nr:ribonuclease HI family protein [Hippea alviniae]